MGNRTIWQRRRLAAVGMAAVWVVLQAATWGAEAAEEEQDRDFWAFRTLATPEIPGVGAADKASIRTPVDAFIVSRLESAGLRLSPPADKATLARRAYLDLLGMPPSPEELDAFLADRSAGAFEALVDRLLASPHFGERWGRHWLDVAGYTDTVGFDIDATQIIQSEGKWRYRDYVVAAFNDDKPYDAFITEQLAGDELVDWRAAETFTPRTRELLVATGFLRTAQDFTHEPESNIPLNHYAVLHDTIEIVGSSLLGLTLNCARCHSHKFDPIPQTDYYRLMAIFTPAYNPADWKAVFPYNGEIADRALADVSPAEKQSIEQHNAEIERQAAALDERLGALRRPYEERLLSEQLATLPEAIRADTLIAILTDAKARNEVQAYLAGKFESLRPSAEAVTGAMAGCAADQETSAQLTRQAAELRGQRRTFGKIQALFDVGPPPETHLLRRGDHLTPGNVVEPGFLQVLSGPEGADAIGNPAGAATSGRRAALARWLTEPDSRASALSARVMVNRVWGHLFGEGIVATPDNFGRGGERPTHGELLEWLSRRFVDEGWRIKPLIKLLMTSSVYQQASDQRAWQQAGEKDPREADPGNRLLWRMRLRRLESEAIRDSVLAASGSLNRVMGGPPILLEAKPDGMIVVNMEQLPHAGAQWRRSVYLLSRRAYHLSFLTVFDQPVLATNCLRRDRSAVPLQALTMSNGEFLMEQAEHLAGRVRKAAAGSPEQVELLFRLTLSRRPAVAEAERCVDFLNVQRQTYQDLGDASAEAAQKALVQLCHTLLNTSEMLYIP